MPQSAHPVPVLIIDDDPMSRDLLTVLLEAEGYAATAACSGDAALTLLSEEQPPRIILTDMQMPGLSGAPLARRLREVCGPSTLLLAMSGSNPSEESIASFDGFLMKPFTMRQLADARSARSQTPRPAPDATQVAASPAPILPTLNEIIYRQLAASMPEPQLLQMYSMCLDDARRRIADMRRLTSTGDRVQFTRQAHSIKGGAGMLGATELYTFAGQLESSGPAAPGAVNPLDELSRACDRLERILAERAQSSASSV